MSHTTRIPSVLAIAVGSILLLHPVTAKPAAEREVYKEVIVPILRGKCYQCHAEAADNPSGKKKIKAKLDLTTIELIKKGGDEAPAAVAGDLEESLMIER
ncbi:MAG: c-type cytochrome domain-containing protein, partial [Roseibacillus sp.]|nr:c-type cytochrome domain-containing protein [Roseibacillus sp.]